MGVIDVQPSSCVDEFSENEDLTREAADSSQLTDEDPGLASIILTMAGTSKRLNRMPSPG